MPPTSPTTKDHTAFIVHELEGALRRGNAHTSFEEAVKDISHGLLGSIPSGLPYSLWQLIEHIRITQGDILGFCSDPQHKSPRWPEGYWPKERTPAQEGELKESIERTLADRETFIGLLHKVGEGLYTPFDHGDGQSLFREAILIIDHTSYHTGEIIVLRRLLGDWK